MADFNVDGFLDDYQAPTTTVPVCGRGDLAAQHAALEAKVLNMGTGDTLYDEDLAGLRNRLRALEAEMAEATRDFTFRALPTREWQDLIRAHPPTKDQVAKHGPALDHNPEKFPAAAIAACAATPELTAEQVDRMATKLHHGDWDRLWAAVRALNTEAATVPKSVAAALIDTALQSVASSTTAAPEESPAASS